MSSGPLFRLDLRSLAICRILTGLTIVADLISRSFELKMHYTAEGIFPTRMVFEFGQSVFPSVYLLCDKPWAVAALFLIHACFGLALAAGYRTTAVSIVCWYLTRSLQARNFMVLNGGDIVLISLLFWAVFVPWGKRWSLDSYLRGKEADKPEFETSLAAGLFTLQLPFIYWLSVAHKFEPTWLSGEAVYYALSSTLYARSTGGILLQHPELLRLLTYATLVWELLAPALLLTRWPGVRTATALALAGMHLSFGLFLRIGIFAWTPCLFLVVFVPGQWWERLLRRFFPSDAVLAAFCSRCRLRSSAPHSIPAETRPLLLFVAVFSLFFGLGQDSRMPKLIPDSLAWVQGWTGLMQRWSVFVNLPNLNDGWVVLEGKLEDGRTVDLFQKNEPVDWSKPDVLSKTHRHFRWPTPLVVVVTSPALQESFTRAMIAEWEDGGEGKVLEARLYFVKKMFLSHYQDKPPQRNLVREWKSL